MNEGNFLVATRAGADRIGWTIRYANATVVASLLGIVLLVPQGRLAAADPPLTVADAKAQVEQLEIDAAAIDQDYAGVKDQLDSRRVAVEAKQAEAKAQASKIDRMRIQVGRVALARYQNRQLDTAAQLFVTDNTEDFLSQIATVAKVTENQNGVLQKFQQEQGTLAALRHEAESGVAGLEAEGQQLNSLRIASDRKIAESKRVLAKLTAQQQQQLAEEQRRQEQEALAQGQATDKTDTLRNGDNGSDSTTAESSRGAKALAWARTQIGKPYRFGATGPDAYDCSGLTGAAWRAAGVVLPRTSQQQFRVGKVVSQSDLQPGDIVFFYNDLSHNGLYAGNGMLLDAPRPGKSVRYIKVSYMPFAGARRPG